MKSSARGKPTLVAKVDGISSRGFWLRLDEARRFLAFTRHPWFRGARRADLINVARPSADHLHWPALDVDLSVESLDHPERFPLKSRVPVARPRTARARG